MGPYDNISGLYLKTEGYETGHWYGNDTSLYIVPDTDADIEGPEDEIVAALTAIYRDKPFSAIDADEVARALGLELVPDAQKRFTPEAGYHRV